MATTNANPQMIEDVNRMVGVEYHVCNQLEDMHGIKSVAQSKENYQVKVVAHDDYPILSNIQTVCAWFQAQFSVESAGRVDGDMVVWMTVKD